MATHSFMISPNNPSIYNSGPMQFPRPARPQPNFSTPSFNPLGSAVISTMPSNYRPWLPPPGYHTTLPGLVRSPYVPLAQPPYPFKPLLPAAQKLPASASKVLNNTKLQKIYDKALRNAGIATAVGGIGSLASLFMTHRGGKLGLAGLLLQVVSSFILWTTPNAYYQQALSNTEPQRLKRLLIGTGLLAVFGVSGFKASIRLMSRSVGLLNGLGGIDRSPLMREKVVNVIKDITLQTVFNVGFSNLLGAMARKNPLLDEKQG